jgi:hypothetical protein
MGYQIDDDTIKQQFNNILIEKLYDKIKNYLDKNAKLIRCYANGYTFGNDANIHFDDRRKNTTTFLFYPIRTLECRLGRGNLFFGIAQNREIIKSIIPKSNRMVKFDSNIWHGARPISRQCNELRITLMFKFITL